MPQLMVQIDGVTLPLSDCFWVRYNPDGCAVGSLLGECATNEEQAHKEFTSRQRDRDREDRRGYRHELVTREQWQQQAQVCLLGECQHRGRNVTDAPLPEQEVA